MSQRDLNTPDWEGWTWTITSHACRICLSRILECSGGMFMCPSCEAQTIKKVDDICGCGLRVNLSGSRKDNGFRCSINENRSPAMPAAIVITFAGDPKPTPAAIQESVPA
jgi:hypothetical protein